MSHKSKGLSAERELIHKFWKFSWSAIRCAGSGSIKYPAPDILAGNNLRKIALECKSTSSKSQYLTKKEVFELKFFSERFGAEPWIAVRFDRKGWFFLTLDDLRETGSAFVVDLNLAELKGLRFEELISS